MYQLRLILKGLLIFLIVTGCDTKKHQSNLENEKPGSIASKMNVDSVISNYITPISIDSLYNMIERDTTLDGDLKSILDSLLQSADSDSL